MDHQENANLYPDTLSISEDDGIRSIVIKQGPTELTISQIGDWFSNGLTYNLRSEYNDSCIFAKVTWILADSIEILSYMESAVFQGDSIYDINQDGINDLVLTYKDGESRLCKMYLMGTDGKVYVEKEIWNYYPLLNQEFVKKDKLILGIVSFIKQKWNKFEIDTLESLYYDFPNELLYATDPLEKDEQGAYVKSKTAIGVHKKLDECYRNLFNKN